MHLAENMIRLSGFKLGRNIKIMIVGVRPGEKLYEEILIAEEGTNATCHSRTLAICHWKWIRSF
jgi:FlaA1/EpsC-like NDP-sugar epimerase